MRKIIACGSIRPELEMLAGNQEEIEFRFLPQNLHRIPEKLTAVLQKAIDETGDDASEIVLGYGLCSNGVVGLKAPHQGLFIPRVHDCIAFYLGSHQAYQKIFSQKPGTYHLTRSWIDNQTDPLGLMRNEYTRRVGPELAEETIRTEIRNYRYISYVSTIAGDSAKYRACARENARFFDKEFIEYPGSDEYFRKILYGPYQEPDFIRIDPGTIVKQKDFLK
ncbi:MAG TPA: DUF1638 domain-containing protein [Bacteroidales bacterium]|nr:DUF1638 domain-containing protein [Bacteroidales bacterium]